jgi:hypothetical protein
MHQLLAQAALIDRVLVLERYRRWVLCGDGGGWRLEEVGVDVGLKRKALDEECQQSEQRYEPLRDGGLLNQTGGTARHTFPGEIRP